MAPQLLSDPLPHDSRRGALKLNLHYPHLTSLIFIALTPVTATGATARILNPARLHSPQIKSSPCQLWCLDIESKLSATPPQRNSLFKAQTLATFQTPLCSPIELQPFRLLKESPPPPKHFLNSAQKGGGGESNPCSIFGVQISYNSKALFGNIKLI